MGTAPSATRRTHVREAQLNDDVLPGGVRTVLDAREMMACSSGR